MLSAALIGCAAHTNLEPKGKGEFSAAFSVGGPIVEAFGTNIPVPYAAVGGEYGVMESCDVNANLHVLPLAYKLAGLDAGVTWYPVLRRDWIPTIGLQPRLFVFASMKQDVDVRFKLYPAASLSAAWKVFSGLGYVGADALAVLSPADYDDEAASLIFSPFLGYRWAIGEDMFLFAELKWQGANVRSDQLAVEYLPIHAHGAVTTLFSIQRRF